jgi:hypothetical protein
MVYVPVVGSVTASATAVDALGQTCGVVVDGFRAAVSLTATNAHATEVEAATIHSGHLRIGRRVDGLYAAVGGPVTFRVGWHVGASGFSGWQGLSHSRVAVETGGSAEISAGTPTRKRVAESLASIHPRSRSVRISPWRLERGSRSACGGRSRTTVVVCPEPLQ